MGEARVHARVQGAVQGVGFRPFIYRIARKHQLTGHVMNVPDGVILEAEGQKTSLDAFLLDLEQEKPPLSLIDQIEVQWINPVDSTLFEIRHSEGAGDPAALIMADVATCADCLQDIHNPKDRRYRYPFTNCTNCGPRFTILHRLPYDRMNTTMRGFAMCPECQREYNDPGDRRFHAQPTACPACGPQLALWDAEGREQAMRDEALLGAAQSIREGRRITAMPIMVKAAFLGSGFLNADTPFEITSTPVSAVQPDEKARRRRNSVKGSVGVRLGSGSILVAWPSRI